MPQTISVVGFGFGWGQTEGVLLTKVGLIDPDCVGLWACTDVLAQLQILQAGLPPKAPVEA